MHAMNTRTHRLHHNTYLLIRSSVLSILPQQRLSQPAATLASELQKVITRARQHQSKDERDNHAFVALNDERALVEQAGFVDQRQVEPHATIDMTAAPAAFLAGLGMLVVVG
jgi:hypothetical protein